MFSAVSGTEKCALYSWKIPQGESDLLHDLLQPFSLKISIFPSTLSMNYPNPSNLVSNDWSEHKQ